MGWIALVLSLLLEQLRPLPLRNPVHALAGAMADATQDGMNAGQPRHGLYAWLVLVGGVLIGVGAVYAFVLSVSWWLALLVNVAVLHFTMGFRQFSHRLNGIQVALASGDLAAARGELAQWKAGLEDLPPAAQTDADELVRQACGHGLQLAHRHLFGVLFWFVLLPGPLGPVLYRLAEYLARRWNRPPSGVLAADRFGEFARRAFAWIDWLPARLTALGFAIVGDFEGAIDCWRRVSRAPAAGEGMPQPDSRTVVLAAAGGALGHRVLGVAESARYFDEAGVEGGGLAEPGPAMLGAVVGLVWRALVLWLLLLLLISVANWFA
ncbi:MAG: CobD/CbiB family protein [Burkholderiaceae bacterium]|nr:CobD/CbiB family protein [Burkholderiaceae bacterium]